MKKSRTFILATLGIIAVVWLFKDLVLPRLGLDFAAVLPAVVAALTNEQRVADNLSELNIDPKLEAAAQAKAEDMAKKSYFAHVSPDGTQPWYWIIKEGYLYTYAGENLAVNFEDSDKVVEAWMNSPSHRFNILKRQYEDIGIGMAAGTYQGQPATFVVQMFGTKAKIPAR
jgi:uncharacterized protein YkwD